MNSLVSHVRAAEKQKNKIEGDTAHAINRPTLRAFSCWRERNLFHVAEDVVMRSSHETPLKVCGELRVSSARKVAALRVSTPSF
jgi:hypothetical protein